MNRGAVGVRIRRALLLSAMVAFALPLLAAPAHAAFPGKNGKIAGVRTTCIPTGCGLDLWTINEDGTGMAQLTSGPNYHDQPSWSADGSKIALRTWHCDASSCGGDTVTLMTADGSGLTQLGPGSYPSWSPDGTKIAFTGRGPDGADVYTMRADGSDVSLLGEGLQPAWSPDGTRIAFTGPGEDPNGQLGSGQDIYVMNSDGSNRIRLTFNGDQAPPECGSGQTVDEADSRPDWSPDGTRIVYVQFTNDLCLDGEFAYDVEVVAASGGPERVVVHAGCGQSSAVWSPDGQKILFLSCGLQTIRPDGTGQTLVSNDSCCGDPDWQPLPGPQRRDYKNAAKFCKADRDFLGDEAFRIKYGGGANAYGKCVSQSH